MLRPYTLSSYASITRSRFGAGNNSQEPLGHSKGRDNRCRHWTADSRGCTAAGPHVAARMSAACSGGKVRLEAGRACWGWPCFHRRPQTKTKSLEVDLTER